MSRPLRVLCVNAGSSSLKLSTLDEADRTVMSRGLDAPGGKFDQDELRMVVENLKGSVDAVGHRVVHGGTRFSSAVRIDSLVLDGLQKQVELAPVHQAAAISAIGLVSSLLPNTPGVACFDTAFHNTLPPAALTYALPRSWRERWGLRRFGFHGLSHEYASRRTAELLGTPLERIRVVTCHLGAGASLAAVQWGRSVDTTMGFTPLDGLIMSSRSGSIDPGMLIWLLEGGRLDLAELSRGLQYESGVVGLAGTPDMHTVVERADKGEPEAALSVDVYVHRLRASIAAMAAAMDGLDALTFTGGVGENSPKIRWATASGLSMLGTTIDAAANDEADGDAIISPVDSATAVVVVKSREDIVVARDVRQILGTRSIPNTSEER